VGFSGEDTIGSMDCCRLTEIPRIDERADDPAYLPLERWHAGRTREADRGKHPTFCVRRNPAQSRRMMNDGLPLNPPVAPSRGIRLPLFYGWILVAIAFVTMAVGVNARTSFSLLFPAILDEFGWDRGMTAGAFSFGFLVSAVVTPLVGRLMDLRGPRPVIELGVVSMGVGLLLASFVRHPWQLYLTLGALTGGGVNCLAYTGQSLYLTNWFVRRRGLALSIAFSGVGIGSITILPWQGWIIETAGWRSACVWLGILVLALLGPLNLLLKSRPEDLGLAPDGMV